MEELCHESVYVFAGGQVGSVEGAQYVHDTALMSVAPGERHCENIGLFYRHMCVDCIEFVVDLGFAGPMPREVRGGVRAGVHIQDCR